MAIEMQAHACSLDAQFRSGYADGMQHSDEGICLGSHMLADECGKPVPGLAILVLGNHGNEAG